MKTILTMIGLCTAAGCTSVAPRQAKLEARLAEESRVLTTAVVDALQTQPATNQNPHTAVALRLARQDQRLEGLPGQPLDVAPLLAEAGPSNPPAGPAPASAALEARFAQQDRLLGRERRLETRLEDYGRQYEAARNERIRTWTRRLGLGGLGIGGLIALVAFVPAAAPILGHLLGWVVGKVPRVAGWLGVVSVKAFDAVVEGVERFKAGRGETAAPPSPPAPHAAPLLQQLSSTLDADHKALVRQRRAVRLPASSHRPDVTAPPDDGTGAIIRDNPQTAFRPPADGPRSGDAGQTIANEP